MISFCIVPFYASHLACANLDILARLPLSEGSLAFLVCSLCRMHVSCVVHLHAEAESGAPTSRCRASTAPCVQEIYSAGGRMSPLDLLSRCTVSRFPAGGRKVGHTCEATPFGGTVSPSRMCILPLAPVARRDPPRGGREWSSHESLLLLPLSCRFVVCFKPTMCLRLP